MAVELVRQTSEEIKLHRTLLDVGGVDALTRMKEVFHDLRTLKHEDKSIVLEACGRLWRGGRETHALVLRWGEVAETNESGQRLYRACGIALATDRHRQGVDLLRTDANGNDWLSYERLSHEIDYMRDYQGQNWETRFARALNHATPAKAHLYVYASGYCYVKNPYRSPLFSGGYSTLVMWVVK